VRRRRLPGSPLRWRGKQRSDTHDSIDTVLVDRHHGHGGYAHWRAPVRAGKGRTDYELVNGEGEHVLTLGNLMTRAGARLLAFTA
jgi:hypothetical protein